MHEPSIESATHASRSPLRRVVGSLAAATGLLVFLVSATLVTSRNWFHDGADTMVARWFSMPWEWSFFVAVSIHPTGWGCLALVVLLPLLVYTAGFFIVFSVIAIFRTGRTE